MTPLPLLVALAVNPAPPADLASPVEARQAAERSLPFVMKSSVAWRDNRKCVSCHQVPFAIWPAQEAKKRGGFALDTKSVDELTSWSLSYCMTDKDKGEFTGGFLSTMVKMVLALEIAPLNDQTRKAYEFFVPLIVARQRSDGAWEKEGNFIGGKDTEREGIEVGTLWTILGLNSLESQAGATLTAKAGELLSKSRQRGLDSLKDAKPGARSDWVALQMLVKQQAGDGARAAHWRSELLRRQNNDGGWPFTKGGDSHPLVTGECLYALAGMGGGDERAIRRAWHYLVSSQQPDGSWKALSRLALARDGMKKESAIATHWGTGWAAIGLLRDPAALT